MQSIENLKKHIDDVIKPIFLSNKNFSFMGIDFGSKRLGISVSDSTSIIASPYETINRTKFSHDIENIIQIIKQKNIKAIVFGWPLNMDGTAGVTSQKVETFSRTMMEYMRDKKDNTLPLYSCFWDERLSSFAVERTMIQNDMSRKRRQEIIDKTASSYMLQGFLDYINKP